jgi:hypothetical protein
MSTLSSPVAPSLIQPSFIQPASQISCALTT